MTSFYSAFKLAAFVFSTLGVLSLNIQRILESLRTNTQVPFGNGMRFCRWLRIQLLAPLQFINVSLVH